MLLHLMFLVLWFGAAKTGGTKIVCSHSGN